MNATEQLLSFMDRHGEQLFKSKDKATKPLLCQLYGRLRYPRNFIVMAGETSSGKSTLVNSMLHEAILPISNTPTTGTVVQVFQNVAAKEPTYSMYNRLEAAETVISKDKFMELAIRPTSEVMRLKLELPPFSELYSGMNVFDTPGFASLVEGHEEVFREFLPQSDIILFTTTYRNGVDQVSRDFLGVIGEINEKYGETPVLLVINRCPGGISERDKRVREMVSAAEDALHRKVEIFLVNTVEVEEEGTEKTLPQTEHLWQRASELCNTQERTARTVVRAKEYLDIILREQQLELEGEIHSAQIGEEGIRALYQAKEKLSSFVPAAKSILERYLARLQREMPRVIERERRQVGSSIHSEIYSANKYLDARSCAGFIKAHVAPFGVAQASARINDHAAEIMAQMDKELEEMANKAISSIRNTLNTHQEPQISKLLENLALRLGNKIAGETATGMLRSFGGVGGAAAGLGNLAKKVVSKVGHLFGKTFSREVYTQIGKVFTKRLLAALTVVMQVFIDTAAFLWEAHHWQGKLAVCADEMLDQWQQAAKSEFLSNLPAIRENNLKLFDEWDRQMKEEVQKSIDEAERGFDAAVNQTLCAQLEHVKNLRTELASIGE